MPSSGLHTFVAQVAKIVPTNPIVPQMGVAVAKEGRLAAYDGVIYLDAPVLIEGTNSRAVGLDPAALSRFLNYVDTAGMHLRLKQKKLQIRYGKSTVKFPVTDDDGSIWADRIPAAPDTEVKPQQLGSQVLNKLKACMNFMGATRSEGRHQAWMATSSGALEFAITDNASIAGFLAGDKTADELNIDYDQIDERLVPIPPTFPAMLVAMHEAFPESTQLVAVAEDSVSAEIMTEYGSVTMRAHAADLDNQLQLFPVLERTFADTPVEAVPEEPLNKSVKRGQAVYGSGERLNLAFVYEKLYITKPKHIHADAAEFQERVDLEGDVGDHEGDAPITQLTRALSRDHRLFICNRALCFVYPEGHWYLVSHH